MGTVATSLLTYFVIELVSLAILVAYRKRFIAVARYWFARLNIQPIVYNTYNTYNTHSEEDEEETTSDLLERMGGEDINYGWDLSDESEEAEDE